MWHLSALYSPVDLYAVVFRLRRSGVPFGVRWVLMVCATVGFAEAALALRCILMSDILICHLPVHDLDSESSTDGTEELIVESQTTSPCHAATTAQFATD